MENRRYALDIPVNNYEKSDELLLGIYGDSFADPTNTEMCDPNHIGDEPWTGLLADYMLSTENVQLTEQDHYDLLRGHHYKGPVEIKGRGGTNLWWSLHNLLIDISRFDNIKNVVFVHTNGQRIHSLHEPNESKASLTPDFRFLEDELVSTDDLRDENEFQHFINLYYKYSHDIAFNEVLGQMVFDLVQKLARKHQFNLVNVMPFMHLGEPIPNSNNGPQIDISDSAGPVITGLQNICMAECGSVAGYLLREDFHTMWADAQDDRRIPQHVRDNTHGRDLRLCHMNIENNQLLAQTILDHLGSDSNKIIDLYDQGNWVSNKTSWSYYNTAPWSDEEA